MSVNDSARPRYRSTRNGFVVASLLLAVVTVHGLVQSGSYRTSVFGILLATQIAFWGSRLYYGE